MNLDSFTGPGSTPSRRRFWDKVTQAVIASQKVEGKNVSVAEHQGMGTIINVTTGRSTPTGECFSGETIEANLSGVSLCFDCFDSPEGGSAQVVSDPGVNGTFTLDNTYGGGGFPFIGYQFTIGPEIDLFFNIGCETPPDPDMDDWMLQVECDNGNGSIPNGTYIWLIPAPGTTAIAFYAFVPLGGSLSSVPNSILSCDSIVTDPFGDSYVSVGNSGSITLSV